MKRNKTGKFYSRLQYKLISFTMIIIESITVRTDRKNITVLC